ncbi:hypothetical protein B7486_77495 [cyanobacterium TDX16]|nr:hypothetical protein B7486_77495 [cyanobacterium TDX16]
MATVYPDGRLPARGGSRQDRCQPEPVKLYSVYLGGQLAPPRMGEDHEVVFVVAEDVAAARKAAKRKWQGSGRAHVDAVVEVQAVDGHRVELVPEPEPEPEDGGDGDRLLVDPEYSA